MLIPSPLAHYIIPLLGTVPKAQPPGRYKPVIRAGRTLEFSQKFQRSNPLGTCHDQFNQFKQLAIEKSLNKLQKFGWDVNLDQYHELVNNLCLSVTEQQTL
ncbi:uncharacterized protein ATNIH1004_010817 [Aspergillus tanneri]|uniref:Uncharacterized protein n=1 Tax=Aspergillus tanneri TaxID=1220188 RepID=A0A5M9M540_9EURO|nr:uncharacterized protein ATNIH1004_010817 [Aspergillus tanneri]KAA8641878.1 hypothetical protein ATNIH1004_010817 [Aspergillus tanneri]